MLWFSLMKVYSCVISLLCYTNAIHPGPTCCLLTTFGSFRPTLTNTWKRKRRHHSTSSKPKVSPRRPRSLFVCPYPNNNCNYSEKAPAENGERRSVIHLRSGRAL